MAEAVVMVVMVVGQVRLGLPGGCGLLGQAVAVAVAVDVGSHERLPWGGGMVRWLL